MPFDIGYKTICIHHFLGHSRIPNIAGFEHPCSGCIPDELNKQCDKGTVRYEPVTFFVFTVEPKELPQEYKH